MKTPSNRDDTSFDIFHPAPAPDGPGLRGPPVRRIDTIALLLLTLAADICLYNAAGGTGFAVLLLITVFALPILKGGRIAKRTIFTGILIAAFCAILIWSPWWLAVWTAFVSIVVFAVAVWKPNWHFFEALLATAGTALLAIPRLVGHVTGIAHRSRIPAERPVRISLFIVPAIVTCTFILIFAAANPVVARELSGAWQHFINIFMRLEVYLNPVRILFWMFWLLVFAALIRPMVQSIFIESIIERDTPLTAPDPNEAGSDNFQMAFITLVCVNVLFLAYNAMDAIYLYFKATLPAGISWTTYTRAGCGWLTLGLLLSTIVLGVIFWRSLNFHPRSAMLKRLAYVWIALNGVLAVGTLRRIYMYIDYSGLTHLLLTGIYGSILVMTGLVIMAVKVHGNHNAVWLIRKYVAAFAMGISVLVLTPHGYVCARFNVPRILEDTPKSLWPVVLKKLPPDALPPVTALLDYQRADGDMQKQTRVREGIAAILGQHLEQLEREQGESWQEWRVSSWWALKHLRPLREKIIGIIPPEKWTEARQTLSTDYDLLGGTPKKSRYSRSSY